MEYNAKKKSVYKGIGIVFFFLLLVPIAMFFFFRLIFITYTDHPSDIIIYMSLGFGGTVGTLFCLICLITGLISDLLSKMFKRIGNLFSNIKIFKGKAIKWYFEDYWRNGGIIIFLFFLWLAICAFSAVFGFINFFSWYNAIK